VNICCGFSPELVITFQFIFFKKSDRNKRNFTRKPTYHYRHSYSCHCWLWLLLITSLVKICCGCTNTPVVSLCGNFQTFSLSMFVTEQTFWNSSVNNALSREQTVGIFSLHFRFTSLFLVCILFCFHSAYLSSSQRPFLNHDPFGAITSALIVKWCPWAAEQSLRVVLNTAIRRLTSDSANEFFG